MSVLTVHIANLPRPDALAVLREALDPAIQLTLGPERPDRADFEVLVAGRPSADDLAASPRLRAVVVPWAGLPDVTRELLEGRPDLTLHNLHHNDGATAEMAVALLLAAAKWLVPADRALRSGDWSPRYDGPESVLLDGKTALVLGYGHIGQRVARVLAALGMRASAVRRRASALGEVDGMVSVWPMEQLHTLLSLTHALVIALPLTTATQGLIGATELALMPRGGLLVNIARGPVVDEDALFAALSSGHLAGAGLDVWYRYPTDEASRSGTLPSRLPFDRLSNVVMSPHRGGHTDETEARRMVALAELLNTAARGEDLPNRVDLVAGY
jgi:phosphoglycerate dehydrogenase-like enzyme